MMMLSLRLARSAAPSSLAPAAQTRALAAKAKGERLTWRQKAKIQAARQKKLQQQQAGASAAAAATPARAKVERLNYLLPTQDDGKKWRILSASVLERLPVVQPDLEDWEMDFEMMQHEIALKEDQRLEDDFWFMEPGERHITPEEAPWPNAEDDPEEIVGAGFHLAPRETADDAANNRKSLNRALKQRVFLLVKPTTQATDAQFPWFFPVDEKRADEKMRDAALRALTEVVGDKLEANPVGFAPMGYVAYPHADRAGGYDGTKVFFYKAQFRYGDLQLNASKASDFEWVTQNELAEYFEQDVAEYLTKMVPP